MTPDFCWFSGLSIARPMSLGVRGSADHPSGGVPSPSRIRALFSLWWYQVIILAGAERGIQGVRGAVAPSEGVATHAADVSLEGRVGGDECQALDQRGRGDQAGGRRGLYGGKEESSGARCGAIRGGVGGCQPPKAWRGRLPRTVWRAASDRDQSRFPVFDLQNPETGSETVKPFGQAIGARMHDSAPWKTEETIVGLPSLLVLSAFSRFGGCHEWH